MLIIEAIPLFWNIQTTSCFLVFAWIQMYQTYCSCRMICIDWLEVAYFRQWRELRSRDTNLSQSACFILAREESVFSTLPATPVCKRIPALNDFLWISCKAPYNIWFYPYIFQSILQSSLESTSQYASRYHQLFYSTSWFGGGGGGFWLSPPRISYFWHGCQ